MDNGELKMENEEYLFAKRCGYAFAGCFSATIIAAFILAICSDVIGLYLESQNTEITFLLLSPLFFGIFFGIWGFFNGDKMITHLESIWSFIARIIRF